MMSPFRFPYQGFPYNYYRPNPYLRSKTKVNSSNTNTSSTSKNTKASCNSSDTLSNKPSNSDDNFFFEIFGLKLFFDDVLLICLIFFLYSEGVKDEQLFISLILLLIS